MLGNPSKIVRENFKEYLLLNLSYYGSVAASMAYVCAFPGVQGELMEEIRSEFPKMFPWVVEAYTSRNFFLAAALTFLINLVLGSFAYITLPSLVVPFGGVLMGCIRAVGWGLVLAPTSPELAWSLIPHSLTLAVEGQGYILAMYAAYLQWRGVVRPESRQEKKRSKAYLAGLKKTARIYLLVTIALAISAVYEAFEVIYIVGRLG